LVTDKGVLGVTDKGVLGVTHKGVLVRDKGFLGPTDKGFLGVTDKDVLGVTRPLLYNEEGFTKFTRACVGGWQHPTKRRLLLLLSDKRMSDKGGFG